MNDKKSKIEETIISALDLKDLPDAQQVEIISRVGQILISGILEKILPNLNKDKLEELESLLDGENQNYHLFLFSWLEDNVPDLDKIAKIELKEIEDQLDK